MLVSVLLNLVSAANLFCVVISFLFSESLTLNSKLTVEILEKFKLKIRLFSLNTVTKHCEVY